MIVFIRINGTHFHLRKDCTMLDNGQFETMGYYQIELEKVDRKKFNPCSCVTKKVK